MSVSEFVDYCRQFLVERGITVEKDDDLIWTAIQQGEFDVDICIRPRQHE